MDRVKRSWFMPAEDTRVKLNSKLKMDSLGSKPKIRERREPEDSFEAW